MALKALWSSCSSTTRGASDARIVAPLLLALRDRARREAASSMSFDGDERRRGLLGRRAVPRRHAQARRAPAALRPDRGPRRVHLLAAMQLAHHATAWRRSTASCRSARIARSRSSTSSSRRSLFAWAIAPRVNDGLDRCCRRARTCGRSASRSSSASRACSRARSTRTTRRSRARRSPSRSSCEASRFHDGSIGARSRARDARRRDVQAHRRGHRPRPRRRLARRSAASREVAVLAASAVLSLATIPLFDATLGHFSEYAIQHPALAPARVGSARAPADDTVRGGRRARGSPCRSACSRAARASSCSARRSSSRASSRRSCRRTSNTPGARTTSSSSSSRRRPPRRSLAPPARRPRSPPRGALRRRARVAAAFTRVGSSPLALGRADSTPQRPRSKDDDAHHERTWASATLRVRHGNREPPSDCINIAYELFYGKRPEAELFFATSATVVTAPSSW